jgi:hypothetical protein
MAVAKIMIRRFSSPDETRPFTDKGFAEVLRFGGGAVGRGVFHPGWRWSSHVKPLVGTRYCEVAHAGYVVSGRMRLRMEDGLEAEMGPGDFAVIPAGHDAWTVGPETCVFVDFAGMEAYARPARAEADEPLRPDAPARPGAAFDDLDSLH